MNTKQFVRRLTYSAGSQSTFELLDTASGTIKALDFRLAGTVSADSSGVSSLTLDSPSGLISRLRVVGQHKQRGQKVFYDGEAVDLYWLTSFMRGRLQTLSAATPSASTTGTFSLSFALPFEGLGIFSGGTNLNDFSSVSVQVNWGALTAYAGTGVGTISGLLDVYATIADVAGTSIVTHNVLRQDISSTSQQITSNALGGGVSQYILLRQFDDSATGNSERTNGIVRQLRALVGAREYANLTWAQILEHWTDRFPVALTTTRPVGVAGILFDEEADGANVVPIQGAGLALRIDTSSSTQDDISTVTAASNDALIAVIQSIE